jgi:hypothetical protein
MTPLRIVVDDAVPVDVAAVRHARRNGIDTLGGLWIWFGLANIVLGVLEISSHQPFRGFLGWFFLTLGVLYVMRARYGKIPWWRPTVPGEFVVSDEGLVASVRGEAARTYPWKRVRTAINNDGFFIVVVADKLGPLPRHREIYVRKPADAALCDAVWAMLYAHMIAPRGLRATPADRLSVIRNTAFA